MSDSEPFNVSVVILHGFKMLYTRIHSPYPPKMPQSEPPCLSTKTMKSERERSESTNFLCSTADLASSCFITLSLTSHSVKDSHLGGADLGKAHETEHKGRESEHYDSVDPSLVNIDGVAAPIERVFCKGSVHGCLRIYLPVSMFTGRALLIVV